MRHGPRSGRRTDYDRRSAKRAGHRDRAAVDRRPLHDVGVIALGVAAIVGVRMWLDTALPTNDVLWLMALFAAALGSAAALLGVLLARLVADQRIGWLSVALACYCLLALPATALGARGVLLPSVATIVTAVAESVLAALLLLALTVPRQLYRWRARSAALAALGVVVVAGLLAMANPDVAAPVALRLVVVLAWTTLAVAVALRAARPQTWGLWRIGLGFALLGAADVARLVFPGVAADVGLTLSNLRLLAIALIFWGVVGLAWQALADLGSVSAAQEEELRLAEVRLARAAERDHELRSGLAGLAGATTVLGLGLADDPRLGSAVASELTRLEDLLQASSSPPRSAQSSYEIAPVLTGLATLRRSSGMDLLVDAAPGVYARGTSRTLAQVLTNVLGNAARHAPGSAVTMSVRHRAERVVIEVRDDGPGVPPGREEEVFRAGEHDPRTGGTGLGLTVCRRMLATEDATIAIRPADPERPGCVVVIELPTLPVPMDEPTVRLRFDSAEPARV